jgi:hypothetical protein
MIRFILVYAIGALAGGFAVYVWAVMVPRVRCDSIHGQWTELSESCGICKVHGPVPP